MTVGFLSLAEGDLAYQRQVGDAGRPGVVFLGGFASDMEGSKAVFLARRCAEKKINFLRFDYRGCGRSPGKFDEGTIGGWLADALAVFDALTEGPQIVVGSSMGGWIGLLLARARAARVKALVGVAAAPDFTEELVWRKLTGEQKDILMRDGVIYDGEAPADRRLPMTLKLIEEARRHSIFGAPFALSCPLRLLQGGEDAEVPRDYAARIAGHVMSPDTKVRVIENGDHRLSKPEDLELLWATITEFL